MSCLLVVLSCGGLVLWLSCLVIVFVVVVVFWFSRLFLFDPVLSSAWLLVSRLCVVLVSSLSYLWFCPWLCYCFGLARHFPVPVIVVSGDLSLYSPWIVLWLFSCLVLSCLVMIFSCLVLTVLCLVQLWSSLGMVLVLSRFVSRLSCRLVSRLSCRLVLSLWCNCLVLSLFTQPKPKTKTVLVFFCLFVFASVFKTKDEDKEDKPDYDANPNPKPIMTNTRELWIVQHESCVSKVCARFGAATW